MTFKPLIQYHGTGRDVSFQDLVNTTKLTQIPSTYLQRFGPFLQFIVFLLELVQAMQQRGDIEMFGLVHHKLISEIPMLFQQLIERSRKPAGRGVPARVHPLVRRVVVLLIERAVLRKVSPRRRHGTDVTSSLGRVTGMRRERRLR